MIRRIFWIVLDSVGIGALPDAADYHDEGSHTLKSALSSPLCKLPNLRKLGLFNVDGIDCGDAVDTPIAAYGKMREQSCGKDTTIGHWELAGLISSKPFPTYPNGFPKEIIREFQKRTGREVLCNLPYSGTEVIRDYGQLHMETGKLIVYTSGDSVFQIAAHEDVVPVETLYAYCGIARELLQGEHAVGRVIARPFVGTYPNFRRTANRHDYSLAPPKPTVLNALQESGLDVVGIGKIRDIFAGSGISEAITTAGNADGMAKTAAYADKAFHGLCFVNLVDFDSVYGHRNDVDGYAAALTEFDLWLGEFLTKLKETDILIITADHGCDPATPSADHSREYVPLLIYGKRVRPQNLGTRTTFADAGATVAEIFGAAPPPYGKSLVKELTL